MTVVQDESHPSPPPFFPLVSPLHSFILIFILVTPSPFLTFIKEKHAPPECQNDNYWVGLGCIVPWDFLGPIPPPSARGKLYILVYLFYVNVFVNFFII